MSFLVSLQARGQKILKSLVLTIKISGSYEFASALKRTVVKNSDPGTPREELAAEPQ